MIESEPPRTVPTSVKLAAALVVVHGVTVLFNATALPGAASWAAPLDIPRALLQLAVCGIIAWGLLHRSRWAWWLGLALGIFWLAAGALTILVFEHGDLYWLSPSGFQVLLAVSLVCLGSAVGLLLTSSARAAFRRPLA